MSNKNSFQDFRKTIFSAVFTSRKYYLLKFSWKASYQMLKSKNANN